MTGFFYPDFHFTFLFEPDPKAMASARKANWPSGLSVNLTEGAGG